MENLLVYLLFFTSPVVGMVSVSDTSDYKLVKKAKDIELYEKWFEYKPGEPARQLKAKYVINAPIHTVLSLLRDEEKGTEWNSNTRECRMLLQKDTAWIMYLQYDLPWPVDDQDCVLQYVVNKRSKNVITVDFYTVSNRAFPEEKDVTRIPWIKGQWVFNVTSNGINTEYHVTTAPNRSMPRWITDPIIRNNLVNTLSAFRDLL